MLLRNFCFTLKNYTEAERDALREWEQVQYGIYGIERGANNTPHLQGYIELNCVMRFNTVKNKFPRMHIEPRRGTQKQAIDYCKKDGQITEWGRKKQPGKHNDVAAV